VKETQKLVQVLWNEIEGSTDTLRQKNIDFIQASNVGSIRDRITKIRSCIYAYYKSNITSILHYLHSFYPSLTEKEKQRICKKCADLKSFQVEIPEIVAECLMSENITEEYCANWIRDFSVYTSKARTSKECIDATLDVIDQPENIRIARFSIFYNHGEQNNINDPLLVPKDHPFYPRPVVQNIKVLQIYWRNYAFLIRRLKEIRMYVETPSPKHIVAKLLDFNALYFDHSFVVNLKRRTDRRGRLEAMMNAGRIPLKNLQVFEATDPIENSNDALQYETYMNSCSLEKGPELRGFIMYPSRYSHHKLSEGAFGIYMSYLRLFQMAIKNEWPYLCVLEDDVCFHRQFDKQWMQICCSLPIHWNILYLGSKNYHPPIETSRGFRLLNEFVTGAHSMLFRLDAIKILEGAMRKNPYVPVDEIFKLVDMQLDGLHPFVLDPPLIITLCAQDSQSDIQSDQKHRIETYEFFHWKKEDYFYE